MTVTTASGLRVRIPAHHDVFSPVGDYRPGDPIDPAAVDVTVGTAIAIDPGDRIIVDNRVEVVAEVVGF